MTVASILRHKSADTATAGTGMTLTEIAALLSERRIGAVPVMDGQHLAGIVSERDIIKCVARHGASALDLPVTDAMSRSVHTATPAMTVEEAMAAMTAGRFRHMPVLDDGRMVGIISIGDVVKTLLDSRANEVETLRAYVAGG